MNRHHIGHIHTSTGWGGGENQVLHLVSGLVARGVQTTLFAHPQGKLFEKATEFNLPAIQLPLGIATNILGGAAIRIRQTIQKSQVDLLHAHDSVATTIGNRVGRSLHIPVILSRRIASPLRRNLISRNKYSEKKLAACIAVSHTVKDAFCLSGYPRERVHVVPSGTDIDALDRMEKNNQFRQQFGDGHLVGGIGKLSIKKNWQFTIRVAAHLKECGHDIQWVVIGDGPEKEHLQGLAESLGVADRIHLPGFMPEAVRFLKSFDALFFPSLSEGASGTIREAMVLKVPVIAVDAPGSMETLDGHGWAVKAGDIPGAAHSILQALVDKDLSKKVCENARKSACERFAITRMVDDTLKLYRSFLRDVHWL